MAVFTCRLQGPSKLIKRYYVNCPSWLTSSAAYLAQSTVPPPLPRVDFPPPVQFLGSAFVTPSAPKGAPPMLLASQGNARHIPRPCIAPPLVNAPCHFTSSSRSCCALRSSGFFPGGQWSVVVAPSHFFFKPRTLPVAVRF